MTSGQRKLAAILAADIVGFSRLASATEELTLARLRALRSDLIDPTIAVHRGRVVKRTGDGALVEFRSVVDAVRCAIEMQAGMVERNAGVAPERQIQFRIGIHLGDVVEEEDGDLMGDGVNIAARLEGIAEPGGICLSRAAHEQVEGKIDAAFADLGERALKNVAKPVRVFSLSAAATPHRATLRVASPPPASGGSLGGGLAAEQGPPRLSIVVLPFANIGGEPEQEYFVDGITESLTTDLSRISGSFVIARNTAFTYKGKAVDVKQIGRELNVRYALEGSVQRGGNRLRVNVQLIDVETGNHLWAERFDKPAADLFDMQDEIVARLANQLNVQLVAAEARRAERAPNPDSMDLYFQGQAVVNSGFGGESLGRARALFGRAVALDPGNLEALVARGWMDALLGVVTASDERGSRLAKAEATLADALSAAPGHALAHMVMGYILIHTNRAAQGIAECQRALALDRNLAIAHALIGQGKYYLGHGEETHAYVQEAFRLSPRDSYEFVWAFFEGVANLLIGADEEAVTWLRRSIETNRNLALPYFNLAAALALLGRHEEARAAAKDGHARDPAFSVRHYHAAIAPSSDSPEFRAQRERVVEGMRLAGIPEG